MRASEAITALLARARRYFARRAGTAVSMLDVALRSHVLSRHPLAMQVLERDRPLRPVPVPVMPGRQRVPHRLGVSIALPSCLILCFAWRAGMRAVRRRLVPILAERDRLSVLSSGIVLSGWRERAAPLCERSVRQRA